MIGNYDGSLSRIKCPKKWLKINQQLLFFFITNSYYTYYVIVPIPFCYGYSSQLLKNIHNFCCQKALKTVLVLNILLPVLEFFSIRFQSLLYFSIRDLKLFKKNYKIRLLIQKKVSINTRKGGNNKNSPSLLLKKYVIQKSLGTPNNSRHWLWAFKNVSVFYIFAKETFDISFKLVLKMWTKVSKHRFSKYISLWDTSDTEISNNENYRF